MDSPQPPEQNSQGEEEIGEQGLVYPPPPSYYQNMQVPAERPPLPGGPPKPTQPISSAPPTSYPYGTSGQLYAPPRGRPPFPPYAPGQFPGTAQRAKRLRKNVWLIVSIIGIGALLLCGAGGWALYNIFGTISQQVNNATGVVQDFYQHVQSRDYSGAYQDLQMGGQTSNGFLQEAQAVEQRYGALESFNVEAPSFGTNTGSSRWHISVDITRSHASYTVLVTVDDFNGDWKITDIDLNRF